jgi:hypothetical protein
MRITLDDINLGIVGKEFNGKRVLRVHDGTINGTTKMTFRYKLPIEGGYLKDNEEKLVILESHTFPKDGGMSGPVGGRILYNNRRYGVELIEIVPTDYDQDYFKKTGIKRNNDMKVWWKDGHVTEMIVDFRHPISSQPLQQHEEFKGGEGHEGTWQEFVDAVNAADPDTDSNTGRPRLSDPDLIPPTTKAKGKK